MQLFEKHRPQTLAEVVGQDRAVAQIQGIQARTGFGGRAVWISGASGTGKTTLGRIIAGTIADPWMVTEYDSADDFGAAELESMRETMGMTGMGKGGRAWILNEAHSLRRSIIRPLLGILERLPAHCVVVFTTTRDGEDALFEDQIDAGPLLSRCLPLRLTTQGLAKAFAERVAGIAKAEGLDGRPIADYVKLAQRCHNNARAMLVEVEAGAMLATA
jgi:replication-associated recombination protein RarA